MHPLHIRLHTSSVRQDYRNPLRDQTTASTQLESTVLEPNEGIDWARLRGFELPPTQTKKSRVPRSRAWEHGWRIRNFKEGVDYWLCRRCHLDKSKPQRPKGHVLVCTCSTSSSISHLKNIHGIQIGEYEPLEPPPIQPQSSPSVDIRSPPLGVQSVRLAAVEPPVRRSRLEHGLDPVEFRRLLLRVFVKNNWPLTDVESPALRELLIYTNPICEQFLPSAAEFHKYYALNEPPSSVIPSTLGSALQV
jgi:hypothetical protein